MMKILHALTLATALIGYVTGCGHDQRVDADKADTINPSLNTLNLKPIGRKDGRHAAVKITSPEDTKPSMSEAECRRIQTQISTIIEPLKNRKETIKCSNNSDCREWTIPGHCSEYFGAVSSEIKSQLRPLYTSWRSGACYSKAAFPRRNCVFDAIRIATGETIPVCVDEQCIRTNSPPPRSTGFKSLEHNPETTGRPNVRPDRSLRCPKGSKRTGKDPPRGFEQGCEQPDGAKHGKWILWFPDGRKLAEEEYQDGKQDGKATSWHRNGLKHEEGEYQAGKKLGTWTSWYQSGQKNRKVSTGTGKNSAYGLAGIREVSCTRAPNPRKYLTSSLWCGPYTPKQKSFFAQVDHLRCEGFKWTEIAKVLND